MLCPEPCCAVLFRYNVLVVHAALLPGVPVESQDLGVLTKVRDLIQTPDGRCVLEQCCTVVPGNVKRMAASRVVLLCCAVEWYCVRTERYLPYQEVGRQRLVALELHQSFAAHFTLRTPSLLNMVCDSLIEYSLTPKPFMP